jgi:type I restriction enzyme S subunit
MSNESRTMKQHTKRKLTPRLRFPEFRHAPEWRATKLGLLGELVSGLTYSPDDIRDQGLLVLRSSNIQNGEISLDDCVYVVPTIKRANLAAPNDILICVRNGSKTLIGKSALIPDGLPKSTHGAFMTVLRAPAAHFVFQLLRTVAFQKQVAADLGATINSINGSQLLKYRFIVPKRAEQQKIAKVLSTIDELIAAQARKVEALKAHKKGLMQQLFPREGEALPSVRFPAFRDAAEWQPRAISDILRRASTPVDVSASQMYRQIGIRSHGKGIFHKESVSGKALGNKRVFWIEKDALVVNIVFAWEQAVAVTSSAETGMIASHRFPMYKPKGNSSDVTYLKFFFLTPQGKHLLGVASPGGAGRNKTLGQKEFENIKLIVPPEVEEQNKLADCLSSVDALIEAQTQKLAALKTQKTGLMQQLFPSSDEAEV